MPAVPKQRSVKVNQISPTPSPQSHPRWLSPLLVIVVVLLGYGLGPTRLPLIGEETCRVLYGIEMARTGNWTIATIQGEALYDRPPLQYWMLAIIHKWIHVLDPLTIRLSSFAITLATALLIWWYARRFFSAPAAFMAAVAYPTMGHVFDLGRRAETDALFTLLLTAALLVWHYGYTQGWGRYRTWIAGGSLAALAALTKGTQGPIAFFATIYLYLLLRKDWRYFWHLSHLAGIFSFLAIIAIWQVPFYFETGWEGLRQTWIEPSSGRMGADSLDLMVHLTIFPLKVLGATLPWSPLLIGLCFKRFWELDKDTYSSVLFMLLGIAAIFVPVWMIAGGLHRYVMPMYPLLAVLGGAVIHQCLTCDLSEVLRRFWRDYIRIMATVIAGFALVLFGATIASMFDDSYWVQTLAQPWWQIIVLIILAVAAVIILARLASSNRPNDALLVNFTMAAMMAIVFNGPVINATVAHATNIGPDVAALRQRLPDDVRLVSLGRIHHKFHYWYQEPIPILPRPRSAADVPDDLEYFAINVYRGQTLKLPFEWEHILTLNMDRTIHDHPEFRVIVGRRIRPPGIEHRASEKSTMKTYRK